MLLSNLSVGKRLHDNKMHLICEIFLTDNISGSGLFQAFSKNSDLIFFILTVQRTKNIAKQVAYWD